MAVIIGTTPLTYTPSDPALQWDTSLLKADKLLVVIANTGANSMDYKLFSKADPNGTSIVERTATIDAGASEMVTLESPKAWISVDVVATDGTNATSFEIQTSYQ